jgi:hypothetical protein
MSVMRASWALILLMVLCSLGAAAQVTGRPKVSPREFVESFFQWYVQRIHSDIPNRFWDSALNYKRSAFSSQLFELLKEDSDAQARCHDLVGPDWDLFLYTQEPAERYVVGRIAQRGQTYLAGIYAVRSGKQGEKPDETAEFVEKDGHWFFVNFHYPDGDDLLTILKSPRLPCSRPRPASKH